MSNIQYILNSLRNTIDSMDYITSSDYDKLTTDIEALEHELLYRDEYDDYLDTYNEIEEEEDEDLYN